MLSFFSCCYLFDIGRPLAPNYPVSVGHCCLAITAHSTHLGASMPLHGILGWSLTNEMDHNYCHLTTRMPSAILPISWGSTLTASRSFTNSFPFMLFNPRSALGKKKLGFFYLLWVSLFRSTCWSSLCSDQDLWLDTRTWPNLNSTWPNLLLPLSWIYFERNLMVSNHL